MRRLGRAALLICAASGISCGCEQAFSAKDTDNGGTTSGDASRPTGAGAAVSGSVGTGVSGAGGGAALLAGGGTTGAISPGGAVGAGGAIAAGGGLPGGAGTGNGGSGSGGLHAAGGVSGTGGASGTGAGGAPALDCKGATSCELCCDTLYPNGHGALANQLYTCGCNAPCNNYCTNDFCSSAYYWTNDCLACMLQPTANTYCTSGTAACVAAPNCERYRSCLLGCQ